jgi:hypothetical protein
MHVAVGLALWLAGADGGAAPACVPPAAADGGALEKGAQALALSECWEKAGEKKKAVASAIEAADGSDAAVRLQAYAALARLGHVLRKPKDKDDCVTWRPDPGQRCRKSLHACSYAYASDGNLGGNDRTLLTGVGLAQDEQEARDPLVFGDRENINSNTFVIWHFWRGDICTPEMACVAHVNRPAATGPACDEAVARCKAAGTKPVEHQVACTFVFVSDCLVQVGMVCDGKPVEVTSKSEFTIESAYVKWETK